MRKVVVTEFMTLDGVIHEPMWSMSYWNDDIAKFKAEEQLACDALLLGRVTYEGFAASWPGRTGGGAEEMNSLRKYVVSTTMDKAEWNNSVIIKDNVVDEITRLKQQDGKDILVYGSAKLIQTLARHDLIDIYRLLVYPVVVGTGNRLFQDGTTAKLNLVKAWPITPAVTALIYEAARN